MQAELLRERLAAKLAQAGLSPGGRLVVEAALANETALDPDLAQVDRLIEAQRQAEAELAARHQVSGNEPTDGLRIAGVLTSLDKAALALEGLLMGQRPEQSVQPFSGIREAYVTFSGDYEMTGMFHPDRVGLANVTTGTMAGLVANAMNKVVVNQFQQYPRWWEPIVTREDFSTLQQVRWITLGGVGELPTVPEGGAYPELSWDDQTETSEWVKKGGYLGLTLEMIDRDDTQQWRMVPRALAQSAWLSLARAVAGIFSNSPADERRQSALPCRPQQPGQQRARLRRLDRHACRHAQADRTALGRAAGRARRAQIPARAAGSGRPGAAGAGLRGAARRGHQRRQPVGRRRRPRRARAGRAAARHRHRSLEPSQALGRGGRPAALPQHRARLPLWRNARDLLRGHQPAEHRPHVQPRHHAGQGALLLCRGSDGLAGRVSACGGVGASPCSVTWTVTPRPSPPGGEGTSWRLERHDRVRRNRR